MTTIREHLADIDPKCNNNELEDILEATLDTMIETNRSKGREYRADQDSNVFENFIRNSRRIGQHPIDVLAVYLFKHIDSLETWFKRGGPLDEMSEPIEGRINDIHLYMEILKAMIAYYRDYAEKHATDPNVKAQFKESIAELKRGEVVDGDQAMNDLRAKIDAGDVS